MLPINILISKFIIQSTVAYSYQYSKQPQTVVLEQLTV